MTGSTSAQPLPRLDRPARQSLVPLAVLRAALRTLWFSSRFANSRFGLVIRGAKSNELRMTALGFPVFRYRLAAFTLSGAFGGLSGILLANEGAYISPAMMSWVKSGDLIVIVVLGGMGTLFRAALRHHRLLVLEESLKAPARPPAQGLGRVLADRVRPDAGADRALRTGGIDSWFGPPSWLSAARRHRPDQALRRPDRHRQRLDRRATRRDPCPDSGPNGAGKTTLVSQLTAT